MKDLSIVIPAWNEAQNLVRLLPGLRKTDAFRSVDAEILVLDAGSGDGTREICAANGSRYIDVGGRGYGRALRAGFEAAEGKFILTMDADFSHPSEFIGTMWAARESADVIIASRYVAGGSGSMPASRRFLSRVLNWAFRTSLHIPVRDLSSGFRLYRASILRDILPISQDFDVLQEILIMTFCQGYRVREVPFSYQRREAGSSHARLVAFGWQYLKTFGRMWKLRNSISSGDYDLRAHDSIIPIQRWWQRRRYRIITAWAEGKGPALDVGCGSSRILGGLGPGSVGMDPSLAKLRHARRFGRGLVAGGLPELSIRDGAFPLVICSNVIEHLPADARMFSEFARVLSPGGTLILATPDYGRLAWRVTEWLYHDLIPGGYADEHITHFTRAGLKIILRETGFEIVGARYIGGGEVILLCRKTAV